MLWKINSSNALRHSAVKSFDDLVFMQCDIELCYSIHTNEGKNVNEASRTESSLSSFCCATFVSFFLLCMHMWQSVKKNYNLRSEFLVFFVLFLLISERAWKLTLKKKTTAMTYSKDFSIEKPHHTMRWIVVRAFVSTLCADRNKAGVLKLCDRFIV